MNIEHAYYERMGQYETFEGLCFVDTLDMAEAQQIGLFTPANTERVTREKGAAVTVIIGNPPYNVGQKSENDNNQNRKYKVIDKRIRDTYAKDSAATNKNSLSDMYVKFFRWASDRLGDRDGIVCFVSNNSFVDQIAFDGMRKHLARDFQRIDHVDLHGNVRRNPKLSGTTHNVFGIQVGVGVTLAVRKKGKEPQIRYHRVPEMWRKAEKLRFVGEGSIPWVAFKPDQNHTWLVLGNAGEYAAFQSMASFFEIRSRGLQTTRDATVYDWNREKLSTRVKQFIGLYNTEVYRRQSSPDADWPSHVDWSRDLKQDAIRGRLAEFAESNIRRALYRPFAMRWLYFDRVLNEEVYQWAKISGPAVCLTDIASEKPFMIVCANVIADLHVVGAGSSTQCFPLSHVKQTAVDSFQQYYSDETITKESIFRYIYALLHHPDYRERYAFVAAGKELARLHVDYESLAPWPLKELENKDVPFSQRVTKMKLAADKQSLWVNPSLTLAGIPVEAFEYRLGSRSALEWIVDQYQVKGESDPNRGDDPGYIVRLVGQVVRVSVETVAIVRSLPGFM